MEHNRRDTILWRVLRAGDERREPHRRERGRVAVGDVLTREDFATTSTQRVRHLSEYAVQRQQYDWAYLTNKTSSLQTQVSVVVDSVSVPKLTAVNASFAHVKDSVRRITECVSAETGACDFGPDVAAAYLAVVSQVSIWMEIAEQTVDALTVQCTYIPELVRCAGPGVASSSVALTTTSSIWLPSTRLSDGGA